MLFKIDPSSEKPVYQQIIDQVIYAIAAGSLRDGDRLDSIRDIAAQTRVNRNTVARAFLELEREGVVRTRAGQGTVVRGDGADPAGKGRARRALAAELDTLIARAHQYRMTEADILDLLRERLDRVNLIKGKTKQG